MNAVPCLRASRATMIVLLLACAALPARAADARDDVVTRTATATSAGLDLATASGAASLHRRILRAAERSCGRDDGDVGDAIGPGFRDCVDRAVAAAAGWEATRIAQTMTRALATAATPFARPARSADAMADR